MPIHADTSPNIKWPLPAGQPAFSKSNLLPEDMLAEIKDLLKKNAHWGPNSENEDGAAQYHTITGRWVTEIELPERVWGHMSNLGTSSWGRPDLKLKNIWFARYQKYKGVTPYLWEHIDQPGTQYTIDMCIESPGIENWGLIVDDELFNESENSGVFFMGQQQTHSRPPYPVSDEDSYIVLMFSLFVGPEHWLYDIDAYDPEQDEHLRKTMDAYISDGDVRYYEHRGYTPRLAGLPVGNYPCLGGECYQCSVVDDDFIDNLPGYVHLK